jgi:hypothetical protein
MKKEIKKCKWCGRDINEASGCGKQPVVGHNQRWDRYSFGKEDNYNGEKKCPDCCVTKGNFHHVHCGVEMCPRCRGKIAVCGCFN